ncbi:MAG TPA: response regulator [Chryseosolibacter sp.]|nr:response regulator [Chryseosolibacter sp.]
MTLTKNRTLNILIADDDSDDRFLFGIALKEVPIPHKLLSVNNGQQLMTYLNTKALPDVLILDLNMPLKNGSECVVEIKKMETMKHLPIIVYSTSLQEEVADVLYQNGAHYYLQKTDIGTLVPHLTYVLTKLYNREIERPTREKFILNPKQVRSTKF